MTFLTAVSTDVAALELDWMRIGMRLLCAMLVGLVIGTEREYTHRPAGMRTHILVALGSCAVMITGQLIFVQYRPFGASPDPARLAAQVITGVGFLGAGTILREGINVKGLTTAASLWSVACLGIAAGGGYYTVALVGMVFIFITLTLFEYIQHKLIKPKIVRNYSLQVSEVGPAIEAIHNIAEQCKGELSGFRAETSTDGFHLSFRVQFAHSKKMPRKFFESLTKEPSIKVTAIVEDSIAV
jgi:putative Mg2+ transporter-C (MgtC) family protein